MPRALPLHHPTADELRVAHDVYVQREQRDYAYRIARHALTDGADNVPLARREAVHLLLCSWNSRSRYTGSLTLGMIEDVLGSTAQTCEAFENRDIVSLTADERPMVADVYQRFRAVMGQTGAAKALGLLYPRFFPLWDTSIGVAYIGRKWQELGTPAEYYLAFMDHCIAQCKTVVDERAFGPDLLKTLDEWNYCAWSRGWLPVPGRAQATVE
jgi:hypothetical protein